MTPSKNAGPRSPTSSGRPGTRTPAIPVCIRVLHVPGILNNSYTSLHPTNKTSPPQKKIFKKYIVTDASVFFLYDWRQPKAEFNMFKAGVTARCMASCQSPGSRMIKLSSSKTFQRGGVSTEAINRPLLSWLWRPWEHLVQPGKRNIWSRKNEYSTPRQECHGCPLSLKVCSLKIIGDYSHLIQ